MMSATKNITLGSSSGQSIPESKTDAPDFYSRLKPYSLDAACDAMLREAARALRAHDLAEARFWQNGYLSIRPIVKSEIELARYLGAQVAGVRP